MSVIRHSIYDGVPGPAVDAVYKRVEITPVVLVKHLLRQSLHTEMSEDIS